jgi:hypothetical protein
MIPFSLFFAGAHIFILRFLSKPAASTFTSFAHAAACVHTATA